MVFLSSLVLLALVVADRSIAAPLSGNKSIDANLLATLNLMEQYAAASYCANNHDSAGDKLSCVSGNCPLVQAATTTTVVEFEFAKNDPKSEASGYVAVDDTNKLIIVSFRGSHSQEDWATDLDIEAIPTDLCKNCTIHEGFWNSWLKSRTVVTAAVKKAVQEHSDYKIVTTGHSLGGALSAVAATSLRNVGLNVAMYSFGAPRIGSLEVSQYISNQPGGNYRVTHWNDAVPQLPPVWFDYAHVSPEYYINKPNNEQVKASDIHVYTGFQNWWGDMIFDGNGGWVSPDISAHLWYFNKIAQCGSDTDKRNAGIVNSRAEVVSTF
ncbi:alpha/beta-hydrolase [Pleomassaria siparia CBS 279.74]|uniref:Alpha/beta-hydrolase n=1 Tax=Pleomassaria siparia CBS 279.74 TaxID=1314801 RepID=A0A6G1K9T5_9PLEO|nr:alpha/beta-hydrolase [Pleomassaria siparia CBS 279.74]